MRPGGLVRCCVTPDQLGKRPPSRGKANRSITKTLLFDKYRIGKILGEGANAVVKLLEPRSSILTPHLAIKQFKDKLNWPTAKMEARILRELNHKNVIKIDSLYRHGEKVYLILEYFDAPNLSEVIRQRKGQSFEEAIVCRIIKQLVEALSHCHQSSHTIIMKHWLCKKKGKKPMRCGDFLLGIDRGCWPLTVDPRI